MARCLRQEPVGGDQPVGPLSKHHLQAALVAEDPANQSRVFRMGGMLQGSDRLPPPYQGDG